MLKTPPSTPAAQSLQEALIKTGRHVIERESQAVSQLMSKIDANFAKACQLMLACQGRIIVMGLGKSGHIASKVAATLASTGTPAFYVHPAEACHGDLGMLTPADVVLAFSYSGQTHELLAALPRIKRLGLPLISITGHANSALAKLATISLDVHIGREACPLNLAPTASTTASLALGDALAIALLQARGFTQEDFAHSHPGGSLGRRLLLRVEEIMHSGQQVPSVQEDALITQALLEMSRKGLGMTAVLSGQKVAGIFTDGDLRRTVDAGLDLRTTPIEKVMTKNCKTVTPSLLVVEALKIMEANSINGFLVLDENEALVGAFNMLDIVRAGVM